MCVYNCVQRSSLFSPLCVGGGGQVGGLEGGPFNLVNLRVKGGECCQNNFKSTNIFL